MHEEFLQDLDLEDRPEPKWRKPLLVAIGVAFVALIASLSFVGILSNISPSKPVESNALIFSNVTVIFQSDVLESLRSEYFSNAEREIKACLFGTVSNNIYAISSVSFPEVISANVAHVHAEVCPPDTIIDLHSHPLNKCTASSQDVQVFKNLKKKNPDIMMLVMCSADRFALV